MPPKIVKPSQAGNPAANASNAVDESLLNAIRDIVQSVIHEENNAEGGDKASLPTDFGSRTSNGTSTSDRGRPRSFLARFHYFQEKEQVLRLAREKGRLEFQGRQVMIFPDFSAELNKRRAEYVEVKKLFREKEGVRYGLVYPARLRVSFQGQEKMFDTPQAVKDFIADKM
ncbi:hypothetical protein AAFF_G00353560 [Aldrovandia affinis]|uniref:L1 transposable element RRM domain-containing protein n=1 Tax=Aldrovandia affinis TaxID=143900 RepID=A0AAD7R5J5_9TELE|nr:hypothetical protein AAFF_G00353560 [Aldrovandia affinis]